MTKGFVEPSFAGKNLLRMTREERRRATLKIGKAMSNNKFTAGGREIEHAPVTLAFVPPPRVDAQPAPAIATRRGVVCPHCRSTAIATRGAEFECKMCSHEWATQT